MAVNCPQCDAVLDVEEDELDEGDSLTCEECGANVVVTSRSPLELEVEDDEDEDEDYDEDEDDEFDEDEEEEEEEDEEDDWH
jgi:alpha-aminoadipate carrier protein LysW